MKDLNIDGVAVHYSVLSSPHVVKAAPCGVMLPVNPSNFDSALKRYRKAGFNGAFSGLRVEGITDLSFLKEFENLLYLEVTTDKPTKTKDLEALRNLRGLSFEKPSSGIDFSWFPELEIFYGAWHKQHTNLRACRLLSHIRLDRFNPESGDLSPLADCYHLRWLEIVRSTITTLAGIETLEDLYGLELCYMSKLQSLDALKCDEPRIRRLRIERAKNIQSYDPIASQTHLNHLSLFGCTDIPNLKWTKGLNRLEHFSFVDTSVKDGDLTPLLDLERLSYIGCEDKRHYSHKMHEFIDLLAAR